jgi:hypothetical protein
VNLREIKEPILPLAYGRANGAATD